MKLLKLKIGNTPHKQQFRSLYPGFTIDFHSAEDTDWDKFNPFCLAGVNGTGKSNVLEVLASIFFHLECCSCKSFPGNFTFRAEDCHPDAFLLEYLIQEWNGQNNIDNYIHVKVEKEAEKTPIMRVRKFGNPQSPFRKVEILAPAESDGTRTGAAEGKIYLPDIIAGYSSGENEILSIPFRKSRLINFDKYTDDFHQGIAFENPENSLIYIDEGMSQAVLLSCLLFENPETSLSFLRNELGIVNIISFRMNINMQQLNSNTATAVTTLVTDHINDMLDRLKACATCWYQTDEPFPGRPESLSSVLVLDFLVNSHTRRAFANLFKTTFECFRFFQVLYELNLNFITEDVKQDVYQSRGVYTYGKMPEANPVQDVFHFLDFMIEKELKDGSGTKELLLREFSDGEHQLLHAMGICLMLKNRNALLLLDEPETHFNPGWRSKFIRILEESLKAGGDNNLTKDIVLTSHSAYILSDCPSDKVIIFRRDEKDNKVYARKAEEWGYKTQGTSVNILTSDVFEEESTIGEYAQGKIERYRHQLKAGRQLKDLIPEINRKLGDSVEKLLLIYEFSNQEDHA
ncbi:MAG: restriction system-associated AAA family ATPase [Parabacteroides sp.]|nr:restriction system-associated AAA family ATPase [Parabacteroides sp.]